MPEQNLMQVLPMVQGGYLLAKASESLETLLKAIREKKAGGKLVITLDIGVETLDAEGEVSQVSIKGDAKATLPVDKPIKQVAFLTEGAQLVMNDPRQPTLPHVMAPPANVGKAIREAAASGQ